MAERYGLLSHPAHNQIKVAKFSLLTLYHPGRSNPHHQNGEGGSFINAIDAKDRVKEYNN